LFDTDAKVSSIIAKFGEYYQFRVHLTLSSGKEAIMSGLQRSRSSSLCLLLVFPIAVCVHTTLAETLNPAPSATDVAAPSETSTLSPESEGDLLMVRRSYAAAIDAYQRDTRQSAVLSNKIGVAYHHMFALNQARKYYQLALAMNPNYADALNNLAAVYHGQHDYKQAERTYKQALKYSPSAAVTYCNLGTAYFADEKYKPGMEAYRKALALDPNILAPGQSQIVEEGSTRRQLVAVNYYLAKTYAAAGKMEESLAYLRKALQAGFHDRKQLMKDKEFAALRSTPEFHALMVQEIGGD
jgi:tetratricopeptide (TPR) repeat protein